MVIYQIDLHPTVIVPNKDYYSLLQSGQIGNLKDIYAHTLGRADYIHHISDLLVQQQLE